MSDDVKIPAEVADEVIRLGGQLGHAERYLRRIASGRCQDPVATARAALERIEALRADRVRGVERG
jgi:hypothetical protein